METSEPVVTDEDRAAARRLYVAIYGYNPLNSDCDAQIVGTYAVHIAQARAAGEAKGRREARCENDPCPVCGDGPSGEWFEGSDVTCDGCGTMLVVTVATPCLGRSSFSVVEFSDEDEDAARNRGG